MYLKHFQLATKPFQITTDPKFLWMGEKHKEALATLRYGILDNRGFLLLTGEVGTGKTILINRLMSMLDMDTTIATLPDPDLISMDFYNMLADGFKMNRTFDSKGAFLIHLRDFLHQSHANRKQVLLIIDESQRLNHQLMEDIRVLSNIELHDRKLINIFFVGQQEFNTLLTAPQNRALAQRITVRFHITPLEVQEVAQYVQHRLKVAGTTQRLFTETAIQEIFQFSGGIPRLINIICDHALLTAYAQGAKKVDQRVVKECAEELRIPVKTPSVDAQLAPNSKSITNAALRTAQPVHPAQPTRAGVATPVLTPKKNTGRAVLWKLIYAGCVIALIGSTAFAITHFSRDDKPRWDAEALTPNEYKSNLESLANHSTENGGKKKESDTPQTEPADEKLLQGTSQSNASIHRVPNQKITEAKTSKAARDLIEPLPLINGKVVIRFTINSNDIEDQSYAILDQIAAYLASHPEEVLHVRGYTDNSGQPSYNETVSRFRANAVKSYLVGKGAPPDRIETFAMGDASPVASNQSYAGRSRNRRVEIQFGKRQTPSQ
jgi:general secretion pathway protein A